MILQGEILYILPQTFILLAKPFEHGPNFRTPWGNKANENLRLQNAN